MCLCDLGFAAAGAEAPYTCTACAGGSFKDGLGNSMCTQCPVAHYSVSTQACGSCPALTSSLAGSASVTACVSVPGAYKELDEPAKMCPPATFQDEANQTACKRCPDDTYQTQSGAVEAAKCTSCPAQASIRPAGPGVALANCSCDPGYTGGDGGPCVACAV